MLANVTMSCPRCGETMVITSEGTRRDKQAKCPACGTSMTMPNDEQFYRTQRHHKVKRGLFGATTYEEFVEEGEGNVPPPTPTPIYQARPVNAPPRTQSRGMIVVMTIMGILVALLAAIGGYFFATGGLFAHTVDTPQVFNAPAEVNAVGYSPDGKYIVAVGKGSSLGVWDATTLQPVTNKKNIAQTMLGMGGDFTTLAFAPDSKHLAMAGSDEAVYWWNLETNTLEDTIDLGMGSVTTVHLSADGSTMIACYGQFASFVEVGTWKLRKTIHWKDFSSGCAASPDHHTLAVGFTGEGANIYELPSGDLIRTLQEKNIDPQHMLFSPHGAYLAIASYIGGTSLWDTASWNRTKNFKDTSSPTALAFSADSKFLAVGTFSDGIAIWRIASDKIDIHVKDTQEASSVAFSPDGQRLVSGGGLAFSNEGTVVRDWKISE